MGDDKEGDDEKYEKGWLDSVRNKLSALTVACGSAAKDFLKQENRARATKTRSLLPDERSAMITDAETDKILQRSFEYIVGLLEFNLYVYKFQMNHHLYFGFKHALQVDYLHRINEADWNELIQPDPSVEMKLSELDAQIKGLADSLQDVQRMQRSL